MSKGHHAWSERGAIIARRGGPLTSLFRKENENMEQERKHGAILYFWNENVIVPLIVSGMKTWLFLERYSRNVEHRRVSRFQLLRERVSVVRNKGALIGLSLIIPILYVKINLYWIHGDMASKQRGTKRPRAVGELAIYVAVYIYNRNLVRLIVF